MTATEALLPVALGAIDVAREMFRSRTPQSWTAKGDRDFASDLDVDIERRLRAYLAEHAPEIGFLGEEEGARNVEPDRPYWALDPVDGTSNLIHGLPLCGSSLGLIHGKRPVLGVVDLPFLDQRFHAVEGGGAFRNGQPVHASTTTDLAHAIIAVSDYAVGEQAAEKNHHRIALTRLFAERVERVRMLGSAAIDLVWTAAGLLDGAVLHSNNPWDTAAGVIIAREAGAHVVDVHGRPHDTDSATTVTAAPGILDALVALTSDPSVTGEPARPPA